MLYYVLCYLHEDIDNLRQKRLSDMFGELFLLLRCCLLYSTLIAMTISTIFADRDDVAVGGRHDNQTNGKCGGVLPLLALVWDDALLGNARNRRVSVLDPWILADDDRTRLWTRAHREKSAGELADG